MTAMGIDRPRDGGDGGGDGPDDPDTPDQPQEADYQAHLDRIRKIEARMGIPAEHEARRPLAALKARGRDVQADEAAGTDDRDTARDDGNDRPAESDRPDNRRHPDHPSKQDRSERLAEADRHRELVDAEEAEHARLEAAGTLPHQTDPRPQARHEHREQLAAIRDARDATNTEAKEPNDTNDTDKALDAGPDDEMLKITRGELKHLRDTGQLPGSATERWADQQPNAEKEPESGRGWRTITEEIGEQKSWPSYRAAKNDLGTVPGTELHHIVEQTQAKPERSGFDIERVNGSDNLARTPIDVHRRISAHYSSKLDPLAGTVRDTLNGESWEDQYEYGCAILDEYMREDDDD